MFSVTTKSESCNNKQEVVRKLVGTVDGVGSFSSHDQVYIYEGLDGVK